VARFFTLKGFNPGDIQAEFVSFYGSDALVLQTAYKWHKRFAQERTELFDDPRSGRSLQNVLTEVVRAIL
jgi:transposase